MDIDFQKPFIVGEFVNEDRPTWLQLMHDRMRGKLGDKFIPKTGPSIGDEEPTCTNCE